MVGGSLGMAGSISLAGMAALRTGAGLVTLAIPDAILPTVASYESSYMTLGLPTDRAGKLSVRALEPLLAAAEGSQVVACGPGLGRSRGLEILVQRLYQTLPQPVVLDADALNALAGRSNASPGSGLAAPGGPRIITPHPGEFQRLIQRQPANRDDACTAAMQLAREHAIIVVLKGHQTLVTNGTNHYINHTGNPGMATGGSGDVLTGIIAGLLGQGFPLWPATCLAVHLHGAAGDLAVREWGEPSLVASDLLPHLAHAIRSYREDRKGI